MEDEGDLSNHTTAIAALIDGCFKGTRPTTPDPGDKKFAPKSGHHLLRNFLHHPSLRKNLSQIFEFIECVRASEQQICRGTDQDECEQCKELWKDFKDREEAICKSLPERAVNETFFRETANANHISKMLNTACR